MYLSQLLWPAIPKDWWVDTSGCVILEPDWNEFQPDLQVAPSAAWPPDGKGPSIIEVKLVVEVTSPGKRNLIRDRETKYAAYARAGIPLYLIVDRYDAGGHSTLYWNPDPKKEEYKHRHSVPFGEKLTLPEPFEVDIDTAEF
jgi:Uma2 family endonuclease